MLFSIGFYKELRCMTSIRFYFSFADIFSNWKPGAPVTDLGVRLVPTKICPPEMHHWPPIVIKRNPKLVSGHVPYAVVAGCFLKYLRGQCRSPSPYSRRLAPVTPYAICPWSHNPEIAGLRLYWLTNFGNPLRGCGLLGKGTDYDVNLKL